MLKRHTPAAYLPAPQRVVDMRFPAAGESSFGKALIVSGLGARIFQRNKRHSRHTDSRECTCVLAGQERAMSWSAGRTCGHRS